MEFGDLTGFAVCLGQLTVLPSVTDSQPSAKENGKKVHKLFEIVSEGSARNRTLSFQCAVCRVLLG